MIASERQQWHREDYTISDDRHRVDAPFVHAYLRRSYWAEDIPLDIVERAIENSLCFGVYRDVGGARGALTPSPSPSRGEGSASDDSSWQQVGFARVVTDYATFAYLADVFVIEEYRGRGLAVWLMECVASHPRLQQLRRWMLGTRDAHTLYEKTGWTRIAPDDGRWMEKADPDIYKRLAKGQMT